MVVSVGFRVYGLLDCYPVRNFSFSMSSGTEEKKKMTKTIRHLSVYESGQRLDWPRQMYPDTLLIIELIIFDEIKYHPTE